MKLIKARVNEYRSISDSNEFSIGDVTCLVGKNESGKTSILRALYSLKPIVDSDGNFDVTDDYPRGEVTDYEEQIEAGEREHSNVVTATYALCPEDIAAVQEKYGPKCFATDSPVVTLSKGYDNERRFGGYKLNDTKALAALVANYSLPADVTSELKGLDSALKMVGVLAAAEQSNSITLLLADLQPIAKNGLAHTIHASILSSRIPKFLYFDDYYQMKGQDNLDALKQRVESNMQEAPDYPLLGLIELARLDLDQLTTPGRTQALIARLEAAENQLTQKVLKYWSQNKHLRLKFDVRPAQPGDPEGMTKGTNLWGRAVDTRHMVTTSLQSRSKGFIWFFSFLAWYSQLRRKGEKLILLLDEPGLSLHAKAQADLLDYFEVELKPHHQVIYSTHSPFMVDSNRFDRIRIVQDLSVEMDEEALSETQKGTRVITDVLEATPDSLFPLQAALGYEISQSLFLGENNLVVEGVSDLLFLQSISGLLQSRGEEGLDSRWTITPVGGSDKVPTFVALIGANSDLLVATLIDFQKKDRQSIENLYKKKLLDKKNVLTFADFTSGDEADLEDMFDPDFYLRLVNGEYSSSVKVADLKEKTVRILPKIDKYLSVKPLPKGAQFNHYRPARYFSENATDLAASISEASLDRFRQAFAALNALLD